MKIKIKSNLFDADNEKGADETVEVEIKGLFDGHNIMVQLSRHKFNLFIMNRYM